MCPARKARLLAALSHVSHSCLEGGAHRAQPHSLLLGLPARSAAAAAGVEGGLRATCGAAGGDGDSVRRALGTGLAPGASRESCCEQCCCGGFRDRSCVSPQVSSLPKERPPGSLTDSWALGQLSRSHGGWARPWERQRHQDVAHPCPGLGVQRQLLEQVPGCPNLSGKGPVG